MQELWFLCMTRHLNVLYKCMIFFKKKCLTSAIVFVVRFCVIVVINKHNSLKQKRSQNDVRLRGFGSS